MSTDLTTRGTAHELSLSQEQLRLVKDEICKGATDAELKMFLQAAKRLGLDPFSKQIYSVPRYDKKEGRKVRTIQVGIDGFRLVAQRSGRYAGQEGTWWCGPDGVWKEIWTTGQPVAAKTVVLVVVNGVTVRCPAVAHWNEYADMRSHFWTGKPALMLAKCSEGLALRKAFPAELSGFYTPEEMAQAGEGPGVSTPVGPDPAPQPVEDNREVVASLGEQVRRHGVTTGDLAAKLLANGAPPRQQPFKKWIAMCPDEVLAQTIASILSDAAQVVDAEVVEVDPESAAFIAEQRALDAQAAGEQG